MKTLLAFLIMCGTAAAQCGQPQIQFQQQQPFQIIQERPRCLARLFGARTRTFIIPQVAQRVQCAPQETACEREVSQLRDVILFIAQQESKERESNTDRISDLLILDALKELRERREQQDTIVIPSSRWRSR